MANVHFKVGLFNQEWKLYLCFKCLKKKQKKILKVKFNKNYFIKKKIN